MVDKNMFSDIKFCRTGMLLKHNPGIDSCNYLGFMAHGEYCGKFSNDNHTIMLKYDKKEITEAKPFKCDQCIDHSTGE